MPKQYSSPISDNMDNNRFICNCKTCGNPIYKSDYVGYPFCFDCRKTYGQNKFKKERKFRGNKMGQVVHFHKNHAINTLAFDDWGVAMCGSKRGGTNRISIFNDEWISDDAVICIRCIKAFAKQIKSEQEVV